MRRVLYRVAASLDGFIAGPRGELDWIVGGSRDELAAVYESVDTVLLGRHTYELTRQPGAPPWPAGWQIYVFSRTLRPEQHGVTVVGTDAASAVARLRADKGRDIWLFGGGSLFRTLLEAQQVDLIEVVVIPVLLGGGIPLVQPGAPRTALTLVDTKSSASGVVTLRYEVMTAQR